MKKVLLVGLSLLFASSAMAEESQYHCDDVLLKAVSKDKTKSLRICESDNRIASTLFNLTDNTIIFDRLTPKSWVNADIGKEGGNVGFITDIGRNGGKNSVIMFTFYLGNAYLTLEKGEEILFFKPSINKFHQNLSGKGIFTYEK